MRTTAEDIFLEETLQLLSRMKKPVTRQMALKHLEIVLQVDEVLMEFDRVIKN